MSQEMDTLSVCLDIKNKVCWSYPVLYAGCVIIGGAIGWLLNSLKVKSEIKKLNNEAKKLQTENTKLLSDYYKNKHESEKTLTKEYKEIDKIIDELITSISGNSDSSVIVGIRERFCDKLNDVMQTFSQLFDYISCDYEFDLTRFNAVVIPEFDKYVGWIDTINGSRFVKDLNCAPLIISEQFYYKFEVFIQKNKTQSDFDLVLAQIKTIKSKTTKA